MLSNVPNLRFGEFSGEWIKVSLKEISKRVTRKNKDNYSNLPLTISAQHGLIDQNDFFDKQIASKNMSNYYLLYNGEFAYNRSYSNDYPWGAVKRLDLYKNGALSTLYICFAINKNVCSNFIAQYFETSKWYKEISNIAGEGARNHGLLNLSIEDFFDTNLFLPSLAEQQKIADFLTLIDKRIETQSKIIEDLELYKNLIMDNMLNSFDFEELSLKEMEENSYFRIVKPKELQHFNGVRKYISTSSVNKYGISSIESIITFEDRPSRAAMKPIKNSVWFAKMKNSVKVYLSENNDENEYILSTGFYGILCNEEKVSKDWMKEIFLSDYFNNQKDRFSEGSSMSGIKDNQLGDLKVKIFIDRNQEDKSVKFLGSLNSKLKIEIKILEKLKEQKKYLLSNMFI